MPNTRNNTTAVQEEIRLPSGCEYLLLCATLRLLHLCVSVVLLGPASIAVAALHTWLTRHSTTMKWTHLSGVGLGYSRGEVLDVIVRCPKVISCSTGNIEEKHAAWGRQLGVTAAQVRGMAVEHPTALNLDPEGDLMRLKIKCHNEVLCSMHVQPPACCIVQDATQCTKTCTIRDIILELFFSVPTIAPTSDHQHFVINLAGRHSCSAWRHTWRLLGVSLEVHLFLLLLMLLLQISSMLPPSLLRRSWQR